MGFEEILQLLMDVLFPLILGFLFRLDVELTIAAFLLTTAFYVVLVVPLFYLYIRMVGCCRGAIDKTELHA